MEHKQDIRIDLNAIPAHIRDDIGNTLFRMFENEIRAHPERIAEFNALGRAFEERRAKEREASR